MSLLDDELHAEIADFSTSLSSFPTSALVLSPNLNSYVRFQLHQHVEAEHEELKSFSVGEGRRRRMVVADRKVFENRQKEKDEKQEVKNEVENEKPAEVGQ
jgi:hypothetical protein